MEGRPGGSAAFFKDPEFMMFRGTIRRSLIGLTRFLREGRGGGAEPKQQRSRRRELAKIPIHFRLPPFNAESERTRSFIRARPFAGLSRETLSL
jgi:hypothetical protein